ncbi:hypothetical protein NpNSSI1_00006209 [Neofusicoccum parvum]|uniref:Uncharacterized protein n=1 Tax=Botryosphaeria parva (strain UCR-NP2) TaxID=1287680 RepID=R1E7L4_BOTPV|nr:hypothetical protein UCRNP2_9538 [Neofusicoccum parvum UCRNP2]GME65286.1 hypothetical protein NpNSSI1_00006209 [Neofusicoccum parvum]
MHICVRLRLDMHWVLDHWFPIYNIENADVVRAWDASKKSTVTPRALYSYPNSMTDLIDHTNSLYLSYATALAPPAVPNDPNNRIASFVVSHATWPPGPIRVARLAVFDARHKGCRFPPVDPVSEWRSVVPLLAELANFGLRRPGPEHSSTIMVAETLAALQGFRSHRFPLRLRSDPVIILGIVREHDLYVTIDQLKNWGRNFNSLYKELTQMGFRIC